MTDRSVPEVLRTQHFTVSPDRPQVYYNVKMRAPIGGSYQWITIAADVSRESAEVFRQTCVWDIDITESDGGGESLPGGRSHEIITANEYTVWMRYPAENGKVPWGLIAQHVSPEQSLVWSQNLVVHLSVQPTRRE